MGFIILPIISFIVIIAIFCFLDFFWHIRKHDQKEIKHDAMVHSMIKKEMIASGYTNDLIYNVKYWSTATISSLYFYLDTIMEMKNCELFPFEKLKKLDNNINRDALLKFISSCWDEKNVGFKLSNSRIIKESDRKVPCSYNDISALGSFSRLFSETLPTEDKRRLLQYNDLLELELNDSYDKCTKKHIRELVDHFTKIKEKGCEKYIEYLRMKIKNPEILQRKNSSINNKDSSVYSADSIFEISEVSSTSFIIKLLWGSEYLKQQLQNEVFEFLEMIKVKFTNIQGFVYSTDRINADQGSICGTYFGYQIWKNFDFFDLDETAYIKQIRESVIYLIKDRLENDACCKTRMDNKPSLIPTRHALWLMNNLGIGIDEIGMNFEKTLEFIKDCRKEDSGNYAYNPDGAPNIHALRTILEIFLFYKKIIKSTPNNTVAFEIKDYIPIDNLDRNYFDVIRRSYKGLPNY
jgi:hypothetical protein